MNECCSGGKKYAIAFALGAVGGGILLAWATRAIPRIMSGMMQNMMANMRDEGCSPSEI